jgi:hypothetical protein
MPRWALRGLRGDENLVKKDKLLQFGTIEPAMGKYSIKSLFAAVALVAVSMVAVLNANRFWHHGLMNLVVLLLALALTGMKYAAPSRRAFCGGFLILGLTYFLLATQWWKFEKTWELLPQAALRYLHGQMFQPQNELVGPPGFNVRDADLVSRGQMQPNGTMPVTVIRPSRENFVGVGTALNCILFGLLGGLVATRMNRHVESTARDRPSAD